ncbi:MAG: di-trans,poly-cis-decaprenylcistransferase, partial [Candidatus Eremiobacteraeota bacterium]|nr:di-trans,poly-cis-decaprenylcistransferase [Candidatus Eremiobacteraeota bacterium]
TAVAPAVVRGPRHVAIIMDGNRRWARERNLPAIEGHRAGTTALRQTARAAAESGVEILTVYAFSEENWRRDAAEVGALMDLVRAYARREAAALRADNVRVRAIGRIDRLPAATRVAVEALVAETASCDGLLLNLALNYGARTELCDAIRALAVDVRDGALTLDAIDDDVLSRYLYTSGLPDPDLLIRTGGELRVSNFLLYQIAYAELWSTRELWPSFGPTQLHEAFRDFAQRQRRFGG